MDKKTYEMLENACKNGVSLFNVLSEHKYYKELSFDDVRNIAREMEYLVTESQFDDYNNNAQQLFRDVLGVLQEDLY